jgi:hypothetical protein
MTSITTTHISEAVVLCVLMGATEGEVLDLVNI